MRPLETSIDRGHLSCNAWLSHPFASRLLLLCLLRLIPSKCVLKQGLPACLCHILLQSVFTAFIRSPQRYNPAGHQPKQAKEALPFNFPEFGNDMKRMAELSMAEIYQTIIDSSAERARMGTPSPSPLHESIDDSLRNMNNAVRQPWPGVQSQEDPVSCHLRVPKQWPVCLDMCIGHIRVRSGFKRLVQIMNFLE